MAVPEGSWWRNIISWPRLIMFSFISPKKYNKIYHAHWYLYPPVPSKQTSRVYIALTGFPSCARPSCLPARGLWPSCTGSVAASFSASPGLRALTARTGPGSRAGWDWREDAAPQGLLSLRMGLTAHSLTHTDHSLPCAQRAVTPVAVSVEQPISVFLRTVCTGGVGKPVCQDHLKYTTVT